MVGRFPFSLVPRFCNVESSYVRDQLLTNYRKVINSYNYTYCILSRLTISVRNRSVNWMHFENGIHCPFYLQLATLAARFVG